MNNKQAKRVGVMWPKAYNSELRKPVMKKGHFSSSKNLHIWYLQPKNSQTHADMRPGAKQNDNSYKTSLL